MCVACHKKRPNLMSKPTGTPVNISVHAPARVATMERPRAIIGEAERIVWNFSKRTVSGLVMN